MSVELRYRDAHGSPCVGVFEYGAEVNGVTGGLRMRRLRTHAGVECTQRYLRADEVATVPMARLENEIRATARLWQVFGGATYPAHLPRLLGFDLGSNEPYALFVGYAGGPLAHHRGPLDAAEAQLVWSGLVSALLHTTAAGIVHGDVDLPSVWWDGATAQLALFDNARLTAQPPVPSNGKRRDDEPTLDTGPDVQAAKVVLRRTTEGSSLPRRLRRAVRSRRRPTVVALARRTGVSAVVARPWDAALEAGRQRFDTVTAEKGGRPGTSGRTVLVLAVLAVALLAVVVVTVVLVAGSTW